MLKSLVKRRFARLFLKKCVKNLFFPNKPYICLY